MDDYSLREQQSSKRGHDALSHNNTEQQKMSPPRKKVKPLRGPNQQEIWRSVIRDLENLNFTIPPVNLGLKYVEDMARFIRPGIGLIGNEEEEAEYYREWQMSQEAERQNEEENDTTKKDTEQSDVLGRDFVTHPETGEKILINDFLGAEHEQSISDLYSLSPMEQPKHMAITPHNYQLLAANQADFLCRSRFKGMLLGDAMGLGKTLTAILAMWKVKDGPGFSMVVCPKTLCHQWVVQIEKSFEPGHGLTVYLLERATSLTAHELLAMGVDIVVASYEQVEVAGRERRTLPERLDAFLNDKTGMLPQPRRPNAVLHTDFWRYNNLPIKRLVLDEGQVVNKRDMARHKALTSLCYDSVIVLSSTLAHNRWHNFSGYVDFLRGHPFSTHHAFMRTFSAWDKDFQADAPDLSRLWMLQKFLQAFTIIRPGSILKLPDCHLENKSFNLSNYRSRKVSKVMTAYFASLKERNMQSEKQHMIKSDVHGDGELPRLLVEAQLWAAHSMLAEELTSDSDDTDDSSDDDSASNFKLTGQDVEEDWNKVFAPVFKDDPNSDLDDERSEYEDEGRTWFPGLDGGSPSGSSEGWSSEEAETQRKSTPSFVITGRDGHLMSSYVEEEENAAAKSPKARDEWLQKLRLTSDIKKGSPRLRAFLSVYREICDNGLDQKIVVFSVHLRFLDIIAEALKREFNVTALRYDGTVAQGKRPKVQQDFAAADSSVPLLLTATAGSYGLNITTANVVIQTEPWWNANVEKQALARVWRQGQEKEVLRVLLSAENSAIDRYITRTKHSKSEINDELTDPLVRMPGDGPAEVKLRHVALLPVSTYTIDG